MPEDEDAITDAIIENATGPIRAQGDGGSIEQHPLSEQIAADRYVKSKNASRTGLGIKFVKLIPPGAD
jgi:hypothetical protein